MLLLTYEVRLSEPGADLVVNVFGRMQSKRMQLVAWREELDSGEPWAVEPAGEHYMAIDPTPSQCEGGETHPDLKCNPGLLGQDCDGTRLLGRSHKPLKRSDHVWFAAGEMLLEPDVAAGVRLIAIRKAPTARRTNPQLRHECAHYDQLAWPKSGS